MSNLLEKASIITTPTAYNNGELLSVKGGTVADFDFTRGSSATRVNSQGLIEDVTGGTNIPRIDYTGGVGHILLEPQSTNLVTYSEDFTQWTLGSNSTLALDNSVTAPDGSTGVYRLTLPATSGTFIQANTFSAITGTLSIYVKSAGTVNNDFNLYSGSVASPLKTATSEWQRFTLENVISNSFYIINSGDTFISDIYIWGAQVEQKSFPTSYIPTVGSTVTRLGETLTNSGNADLFNDLEGVLYAEIGALSGSSSQSQIELGDGSDSTQIKLGWNNDRVLTSIQLNNTSVLIFEYNTGSDLLEQEYYKVAVKYKSGQSSVFIDGVERATSSTTYTSTDTISQLGFQLWWGGTPFYGKTKCVAVFKEALSNDELECLTGEGYESFSALAQAFNYTII